MLSFKSFIKEAKEQKLEKNPVDVDVYHGSGHKFDKFDASKARIANDHMGGGVRYFTSNKDVAKTYAKSMARTAKTNTPHVYKTNLKMNNVFDVDHDFTGKKLQHILPYDHREHEQFARSAGLLPYGADKYKVLDDLRSGNTSLKGHQVFKGLSKGGVNTLNARNHLIKKDYDGMRYNGGVNMNMDTKHDVYMPYQPNSITIHHSEKI
jgi:ADP-Ribosyltransferase in polyvalent proteins